MTSHVVATYANGVFTPDEPVDLPQNSKVNLTVNIEPEQEPAAGSAEAWSAYLRHCSESKYHFTRFNRELLYDRG
jgi:predicted DNA-binding antitoxin AbrB/MazE fold protein